MKLDWPHVVIYGLLLGFVLCLGFLALKAGSDAAAAPLWAIVATGGGALVTIGGALLRGMSLSAKLAQAKAALPVVSNPDDDTVPPTPRDGKRGSNAS